MRIAPEFAPVLAASGLNSFDAVMGLAVERSRVARWFPGRITARVELAGAGGKSVFLKRYEKNYLSPFRYILRALGWPTARDEARREWDALNQLRAAGISTPVPVAVGEERFLGVVTRSFLMTEEIYGGIQGDHYCRKLNASERHSFALRLAEFARGFHTLGFVHKDFYLCHFFIVPGESRLYLIDFQRATRPRFFRERWLVKDLGGLAFSALDAGASARDLISFYKAYRQKSRLDQSDRHFIKKIAHRIDRLRRHRPKHENRPPPNLR